MHSIYLFHEMKNRSRQTQTRAVAALERVGFYSHLRSLGLTRMRIVTR